jgi:hypothetical protein
MYRFRQHGQRCLDDTFPKSVSRIKLRGQEINFLPTSNTIPLTLPNEADLFCNIQLPTAAGCTWPHQQMWTVAAQPNFLSTSVLYAALIIYVASIAAIALDIDSEWRHFFQNLCCKDQNASS